MAKMIALHDADAAHLKRGKPGGKYPNLALMKISTWHKAQGDTVEWWQGPLVEYDRVIWPGRWESSINKENASAGRCRCASPRFFNQNVLAPEMP